VSITQKGENSGFWGSGYSILMNRKVHKGFRKVRKVLNLTDLPL
jgi:hypothetical protein